MERMSGLCRSSLTPPLVLPLFAAVGYLTQSISNSTTVCLEFPFNSTGAPQPSPDAQGAGVTNTSLKCALLLLPAPLSSLALFSKYPLHSSLCSMSAT